eukprot:1732206-Pyramimonas_sp.AAC.1
MAQVAGRCRQYYAAVCQDVVTDLCPDFVPGPDLVPCGGAHREVPQGDLGQPNPALSFCYPVG